MNILFYIKEYLLIHNTISIDGLGTLYKKRITGKYDIDKHAFVPPSNLFGFRSELNDVDGLANSIAQSENITFENAQIEINQFVENIQSSLKSRQEVDLNGIGKFNIVEDDVRFTSADENIFENDFYGFPTLSDKPHLGSTTEKTLTTEEGSIVNLKDDTNEQTAILEENTIISTDIEKEVPNAENILIDNNEEEDVDFDDEKNNNARIWLKFLLALGIIAVIFGTVYIVKPELYDGILNNKNYKYEDAELVVPLDTTSYESDTLKKDSIPNLDSTLVLIPTTKQIDSNITTYEVIGSAEKSQKRIDQYILIMQRRGIDAKALANIPGKLIKISLGSFTDYNFAKKHQDSLRKTLKNPDIYIQTIKPKK